MEKAYRLEIRSESDDLAYTCTKSVYLGDLASFQHSHVISGLNDFVMGDVFNNIVADFVNIQNKRNNSTGSVLQSKLF